MAIAPVSSSSTNPPSADPMRQAFAQLANAIQSGNLSAAQSAYATLTQGQPAQSGPLAQALSQIGDALQSDDIDKAQSALASLQQQMQAAKGAHHHHGHHHHAGGAGQSQPASAPASGSDPAASTTSTNLLDVTAGGPERPRMPAGMFDTIILLTGPAEEIALTGVLRQHNPRLEVRAVKSPEELKAVEPSVLARARLVAFVTPVLVPARILRALGFGAYNFHPGPPQYPGWVPAHFAIYENAREFGATAHAMVERVDAGPIVACKTFAIPPGTGVMRLQEMAFVELARLFWALAPALATQSEPLAALPVEWGGAKSTRRMYAAMCEIPFDVSKEELERRIAVFGARHYGLDLTVTLHGHLFRYVAPEPQNKVAAPGMDMTEEEVALA